MEKIKNLARRNWLLIVVCLLSLIVRVYKLGEIPYGFDGDEAAFGYDAYSLITNLSDEYGNKLPLYFPSIGDYKYPVYSYLSTPIVALFGLNIFSSRLLSVLCGSFLTVVIYLMVLEVFNNKKLAVIAMIVAALSPYSIMFSRGAYESNVAVFFLSLGMFFAISWLNRMNNRFLYFSGLSLFVSIFTYSASRVFIIIFLLIFSGFYFIKGKNNRKRKRMLLRFNVFFLVITFLTLLDARSRVRANDIGFMRDPWPDRYLTESIHEDGLIFGSEKIFLTRLFHNKLSAHSLSVFKRYLEHFNPVYLFMTSNPNMPKYSVPDMGLFYFFEIATITIGIYTLSKIKGREKWIVILWILVAPVASSLSIETPNPIRTLIGLPAWIILSALGIWLVTESFKKNTKIVYCLFGLVLVFHFAYFWHQYMIHDMMHQPWFSDGGMKEMVSAVNKLEPNYQNIVISNDPYIHFLFFNKVKPQQFLNDSDIIPEEIGKWERVERFGKIIFKMPYDCPKIGKKDVLYVCQGEEIPQNSILRDAVYFPDGKPAFMLVEFIPYSERQQGIVLPERVHYMVDTDLSYPEALLPEDSNRYW